VKSVDNSKNILNIKYPERIRELRQDNDLTQKEVADILKVAQTTYSQYELYKRPMPIECLMILCKFYEVSADYILGFTNQK
jgi:transcriptional regulator with XRE-family HTH domain